MSIGKKLAHKAEALTGATKKYYGRVTGNTGLRTEGRGRAGHGQFQTGRGQSQRRLQALTAIPNQQGIR
jgi:uncharacterized protein YjbJ (UPF0337 family)